MSTRPGFRVNNGVHTARRMARLKKKPVVWVLILRRTDIIETRAHSKIAKKCLGDLKKIVITQVSKKQKKKNKKHHIKMLRKLPWSKQDYNNHLHVTLSARITLTLSRQPSL